MVVINIIPFIRHAKRAGKRVRPNKLSEWTRLILFILIICGLAFLIVHFSGKSLSSKQDIHSLLISPTPNYIITRVPEKSESFKLAKNKYYQFSYPAKWGFYSNKNDSFISVFNNPENKAANDFSIVPLYITECTLHECLNVEEQISKQESYWYSSTSQLGDMDPVRLSEKEISVDGQKGKQYVYKLMKPYEGVFDIVIWYFVPYKDKIFWIKVMGSDIDTLDSIFLSLEFVR